MRFAQADVAQQDAMGPLGEELQAQEVLDRQPVEFLGPIPLELCERFQDREPGGFDASFKDPLAPRDVFALDKPAQVFEVAPRWLSGWLGQVQVVRLQAAQFEVVQGFGEQGGIWFHELDLWGLGS